MDFIERNNVRKRQFTFARDNWTRQVTDRVQLSSDFERHKAWDSATIIALRGGTLGISMPMTLTTIQMEDGTIYEEQQAAGSAGGYPSPSLPLVPHEDYFRDTQPVTTALIESAAGE